MEKLSLLTNTVLHIADRYLDLLFYRMVFDYTLEYIAVISLFSMAFYTFRLTFSNK